MDFGLVELDGEVSLWVVTTNASNVPTAPDSAPTYNIYEADQDTPMTGGDAISMTGPVDSETGFYRKNHDATSATGYERNKTYCVKFNYTLSATAYTKLGIFTVV